MDILLDDDKAIQQDGAQQHQHAGTIGEYNVPCDHSCASEDTHTHLVSHKDDGPVHEKPAAPQLPVMNNKPKGKKQQQTDKLVINHPHALGDPMSCMPQQASLVASSVTASGLITW